MHSLSAFLLGSATFFGFTFALPTSPPVTLDRRACGITYPTSMTEVTPFVAKSTAKDFCVDNTKVRYAHFDIPSNAIGACQLEFTFPKGDAISNTESTQLNVWKTDREFNTATDTWSSSPQVVTLFGTVTLKSKPSEDARIIVNSGDCKSMRDFKFTIAENNGNRTIAYTQEYPKTGTVTGMRIVHSC